MKRLALILFVFLGLVGVTQAQQKQEEFVLTMPVVAPCLPSNDAKKQLEKEYGEIPFAQGFGIVWNSRVEEYIGVNVMIFLNPQTFAFTVAYEVPGDELICVLSTGDNFQPAHKGNRL